MTDDTYVTMEESGPGWHRWLGDSCEKLGDFADDTVDLSVFSPPFASLYTYSPSLRDLGNSHTRDEFLEHYRFVVDQVLRLTKPGRLSCVHDPICELPARHKSSCRSTSALDQYRIGVIDLSVMWEKATSYDSIPTIQRIYDRTDSGAFRCPDPDCPFVRRDAVAMWEHVHGARHGGFRA